MKINALFSKSPTTETDSFFNLHHVPNACTASDSSEKKKIFTNFTQVSVQNLTYCTELYRNLFYLAPLTEQYLIFITDCIHPSISKYIRVSYFFKCQNCNKITQPLLGIPKYYCSWRVFMCVRLGPDETGFIIEKGY